jgi:hypothetical protein
MKIQISPNNPPKTPTNFNYFFIILNSNLIKKYSIMYFSLVELYQINRVRKY